LERYKNDIYMHDYVIFRNKKMRPPKFYDNTYEIEHGEEFKKIKYNRKKVAKENEADNTGERLKVKETIQKIKAKCLIRSYENDEKNVCSL